jgi:hypothetical protein
MSATLWSAEGRSRAAMADGVIAEAEAGNPLLLHHLLMGGDTPLPHPGK